ncbi:hypothetical protein AB6A40_000951 [Gnathostoma spinigerum]|uniref:Uncharacterized protein n=1 Tax=Gnathostoma spinigerum TaxID=75299 RepID=A0ABD6ECL5_9BILA
MRLTNGHDRRSTKTRSHQSGHPCWMTHRLRTNVSRPVKKQQVRHEMIESEGSDIPALKRILKTRLTTEEGQSFES